MDADTVTSILILIILLILGTFFSATEMAFAALNRARIKHMADEGSKRAALVLKLHSKFDKLISTLLICNNAVALTTATVSAFLFVRLMGDSGPVVSTIIITIVIVVFTDDLPKSMAKQAPEKVALFTAPLLQFFMTLLTPLSTAIVKWKDSINARFSSNESGSLRGNELLYVVEEAEQHGTINEEDSTRISNAIEFNDLKAWDIITPRVSIVGITKDSGRDDILELFSEHGYSRIPVYEESLDNIIGFVHIRDFIKHINDKPFELDKITTPAIRTATSTRATELLKQLNREKTHMAVVTDEYGGTEGIVTMEDILRQLVGDIWDENDEVPEPFKHLGGNRYSIQCTADIDKMFEYFNMEAESESNTVSGWIMDKLERIPEKDDTFTYEKLKVTVTKADDRRAEEILVEVIQKEDEE